MTVVFPFWLVFLQSWTHLCVSTDHPAFRRLYPLKSFPCLTCYWNSYIPTAPDGSFFKLCTIGIPLVILHFHKSVLGLNLLTLSVWYVSFFSSGFLRNCVQIHKILDPPHCMYLLELVSPSDSSPCYTQTIIPFAPLRITLQLQCRMGDELQMPPKFLRHLWFSQSLSPMVSGRSGEATGEMLHSLQPPPHLHTTKECRREL